MSFGTNHGWLVGGEQEGNGAGSLVDKDTAHIPLFYLGTTNPNMVCSITFFKGLNRNILLVTSTTINFPILS
jgi:hypothetical protein